MELEANTAARGLGRSVICRVKRPNAILGPYFQNSDQFSMVISPVLVIVHLKTVTENSNSCISETKPNNTLVRISRNET
jgi:hypothetical protein